MWTNCHGFGRDEAGRLKPSDQIPIVDNDGIFTNFHLTTLALAAAMSTEDPLWAFFHKGTTKVNSSHWTASVPKLVSIISTVWI
jgi:hypothetical protein